MKVAHEETFREMRYFLISEKMQRIDPFVIVSYYLIFLACLIYSVVKKHTSSYVSLWLILLIYWLINYFLGSSSFLMQN